MESKTLELMKSRFLVREFSDRKVEKQKVDLILEAARVAPTAVNYQPIVIYAIQSGEALQKLQECKPQHFNETLAFLVCYDKTKCAGVERNHPTGEVDGTIVATHMILEATELGVGSTFVLRFDKEKVIEQFEIEENIVPVILLTMGYAKDGVTASQRHSERKQLEEIVKFL